jgi:hypothetical protein
VGLLDRLDAIDKQMGIRAEPAIQRAGAIGFLWGIVVVVTATLLSIGIALMTRPEPGLVGVGIGMCVVALLGAWWSARRLVRAFHARQ